MALIGNLLVNLGLNSAAFNRGMKGSSKRTRGFSRQIDHASRRVVSFGKTLLATAGVGYGISSILGLSRSIDETAKFADRVGIANDELVRLQHAAELSGVGSRTLNMALQRMTRRVGEAAQGTGEAQGAIKELGLSAQQLAAMAPDQALNRIADAMAGVENQSDRVRLAFKLFDSEGVALVNMLQGGSAELEKFKASVKDALTTEDADRVEAFNDAMATLKQSVGTTAGRLLSNLSPALVSVAQNIQTATENLQKYVSMNWEAIKAVATWAIRIKLITTIAPLVVRAINGMVKAYKAFVAWAAAAQAITLGPAGIAKLAAGVVAAVASVAALEYAFSELTTDAKTAAEATQQVTEATQNYTQAIQQARQVTLPADLFLIPGPEGANQIINSLQEQVYLMGRQIRYSESLALSKAKLAGATNRQVAEIWRLNDRLREMQAIQDAQKAQEDLASSIEDTNAQLRMQIETYGMGARAKQLYRLIQEGASVEQLEHTVKLMKELNYLDAVAASKQKRQADVPRLASEAITVRGTFDAGIASRIGGSPAIQQTIAGSNAQIAKNTKRLIEKLDDAQIVYRA